jgi:uncharacterized protein YjiS (DUF1127 family)
MKFSLPFRRDRASARDRHAKQALRAMSDRQLMDIGLSRLDVEFGLSRGRQVSG